MPRAVDRYNIEAEGDPNRSGTEIHSAQMMQSAAEILAGLIGEFIDSIREQMVDTIKFLTGLDFSSLESLLASVMQVIQNGGEFVENIIRSIFNIVGMLDDLPVIGPIFAEIGMLVDALAGIDLMSGPGAVLAAIVSAISDALDGIPLIGDIVEIIEGIVLGGGTDTGFPYTFPFTFGGENTNPVIAFFDNLRHFFSFTNFASPNFNFDEAWQSFLNGTLLADALNGLADFIQQIIDGILEALTGIPVVGGLISHLIEELGDLQNAAQDALADASDALAGLVAGFAGIFNGWFGSGGTGTVAEVTYTIEAIRDAVINGYTVSTFTSDTSGWTVPEHTECTAIMISGGQDGGWGGTSNTGGSAGAGGLHGSYIATRVDLTGISALDIRIGTAGNLSYVRAANATAHTGAVLAQSAVHGSPGGIAGEFGLTLTTSLPGSGGHGGRPARGEEPAIASTPGTSSALAAGGAAGGQSFYGFPGEPGASVSAGSLIKCGGGGGGGGGYATLTLSNGGAGGAGGYPGGGGGGGGTGVVAAGGTGGPGAPGVVWLFYR